ncbi:unnamed protein product [Fraxinus pennsylvanica]|uniref:Uncharacterized protein n=1 Tax=Fraxinus pennsylvanica TaxID=56036 RepID=A0AAD1YXN1_9LAMI|nr:unnamed protein product [Fraxinus pennsylvanica]
MFCLEKWTGFAGSDGGCMVLDDQSHSVNNSPTTMIKKPLNPSTVTSDCNLHWLTKHLLALAASRNVPLIFIKDKKEGSLRLGELVKLKTTIATGIKARRNDMGQLRGMEHEEEKTHNLEVGTQDELGVDAQGVDFQIPTGLITRARAKKLQAIQGFVGRVLEEETQSKANSNELGLQEETKIINLIQVQSSEDPITLG